MYKIVSGLKSPEYFESDKLYYFEPDKSTREKLKIGDTVDKKHRIRKIDFDTDSVVNLEDKICTSSDSKSNSYYEVVEVTELEAAYLALSKTSGIKVGDTVKVLRKAATHEMGWKATWNKSMDGYVGKNLVVSKDDDGHGFQLNGYHYPFFVLEKVESPIVIRGETVVFKPDGIQVGCSFIEKKVVETIYKKLFNL